MMGAIAGGGVCLGIWKALTGNRPYYERRKGPYSVYDVASTGDRVYRNADTEELSDTPFAGCHTVYDVFEYAISKNGNRPALGERNIVKVRGGNLTSAKRRSAQPKDYTSPNTPPVVSATNHDG